MNRIEAFDVHLDTAANVVTVSGTARYNSGNYDPLTFSFILDRTVGLWTLWHMVDDPFDPIPFLPVTGRLGTDATTVEMAAVRAQGYLSWSGDDPRPLVQMTLEFLEPGLHSCDVHDDYAAAFLDLDPSDWSRVRSELRHGCELLPDPTY